ncbi:hypothetical protein MMC12_003997 [Toensbergia leucococca]|nr:hypothetical protein [Toensbergia leucococca]
MSPSAKRRKITVGATLRTNTLVNQQSIQGFGKISKSQVLTQHIPKKNTSGEKAIPSLKDGRQGSTCGNSKKRKLIDIEEVGIKIETRGASPVLADSFDEDEKIATLSLKAPASLLPVNHEPLATPRKPPSLLSSATDTPTKGARSCFDCLALSSSSPSKLESSPLSLATPSTSPSTCSIRDPSLARNVPIETPEELQDLIHLYSSFLTALSLHYAHYGSLTPADLRVLRPSIERSWGKRRVSVEDIRRILAISQICPVTDGTEQSSNSTTTLSLSDYGNGKICIEIADDTQHQGIQKRPINEEVQNTIFTKNLAQQWHEHFQSQTPPPTPSAFISDLPLSPVLPCASLHKISPLLAKGQRRLLYLKTSSIKLKTSFPGPSTSNPASQAPTSRSSNLLSRILAKQVHQSTLPSAPSPQTLARKSALQRLEEITPVLEILTSSASRSHHSKSSPDEWPTTAVISKQHSYSFTMATLVQHLQMSLRNPVSKDEAVRCMRLLAMEVAPEWVGVREVGRVVGVTIRRGAMVGRREMAERIRGLLAVL